MFRRALRLYFVVNVALFVILALVFPFQEPGTGAYVITVLALAVTAGSVAVAGGLLYFGVDLEFPIAE